MIRLIFIMLVCFSCSKKPFKESLDLGGKTISTETLNRGFGVYQAKCVSCHGKDGDGTGITYRSLLIKPRNLKQGLYKFGLGLNGSLPSDEDFKNILTHGLWGTAMLPWGMNDRDLDSVIQYIKTFAPEVWSGKNYSPSIRPVFTKDPYTDVYAHVAIKKGARVYHDQGQCFSCHRAYLSVSEMKDITGDKNISEGSDVYQVKPQETSFFTGKKSDEMLTVNPPDFKVQSIRSARTVEEIYQRISVGVAGTPMPAWQDVLTEDELWSLAYYVKSLEQKE